MRIKLFHFTGLQNLRLSSHFCTRELRGQHIGDKIVIYALDYAKQITIE